MTTGAFKPSTPPSCQALIVLGARLDTEGEPGRVARLRLLHALNLWRLWGFKVPVLLTGGCQPGAACSEALAMANWSLAWAGENWGKSAREILHPCLILEEDSLSTAASARLTLPLIQNLGCRCIGLVTDAVHLPRAHLLFKRQFHPQGVSVVPLPAEGLVRHYWHNRRYLGLSRIALREGGAWIKMLGRLVLRRP
jgi:uncharacterized SAM-binding protein YcdF (DUF218 family)